jgi:hypothetical protein
LQINTKIKRLEKVANAKYNQTILKKGIIGLAIAAQQSKVYLYAQMDLEMKRKARYLLLWIEAIWNKKNAEVVKNVL